MMNSYCFNFFIGILWTCNTVLAGSNNDVCTNEHGVCYQDVGRKALKSAGCKQYCECVQASILPNGSVPYQWIARDCQIGLLFDESQPSPYCNYASSVQCKGGPSVWLDAPKAGNCRGDTVLTCHVNGTQMTNRKWMRESEQFMINGVETGPFSRGSNEEVVGQDSFSLIIHGADRHSAGMIKCGVDSVESEAKRLQIECKPETIIVRLIEGNLLEVQMNYVVPIPTFTFTITSDTEGQTLVQFGLPQCTGCCWGIDCVWRSTSVLQHGNYNYTATVTSVTESLFTGHIN